MKTSAEINKMTKALDTDTLVASFLWHNKIEMPDGFAVASYSIPKPGDIVLSCTGYIFVADRNYEDYCRPILILVKDTMWVVPTDEDAKLRPRARVKDDPTEYILIRVSMINGSLSYVLEDANDGLPAIVDHCEIEKASA